jgi:hypothetical protein
LVSTSVDSIRDYDMPNLCGNEMLSAHGSDRHVDLA